METASPSPWTEPGARRETDLGLDRATTMPSLDGTAGPAAPGHIFRSSHGGAAHAPGHRASLTSLAFRLSARRVIVRSSRNGEMRRLDSLVVFARTYGLLITSIEKLHAHRPCEDRS